MMMLDLKSIGQGTALYGVQTNSAFVKCVAIKEFDSDPTEYTVSVELVSIDDEFASIKLDSIDGVSAMNGDTVYLEKGTVLTFPEGSITLAESADITDSYDFYPIYESHYDITDGSQSVVFGAVKLPVTGIDGWNLAVNNLDVKTLGHGEQQQNERASNQWTLTLNLTIRPNDIGYFKHILPSAGFHEDFTGRIWIFAAVPSNNNGGFEYGFGSGLVSITSDPVPVNEVRRPVLQVEMQYPFVKTTNCENESGSRKKLINIASKCAGVLPPCDYYELIVTNPSPANGQLFSVLFDSSEFGNFPYTITGVTSADISGESLTGTLSNGDVLTFINNVNADKIFTLSLDNGKASVSAALSKIDKETYIVTVIDGTSLGTETIANIQDAIAELRTFFGSTLYGSESLANKYIKAPVTYMDERYLLWPTYDYRDSSSEPKKYLFLIFVDESNRQFDSSPESPTNSYHYIPRNVSVEPTTLWQNDFATFQSVYPDFVLFDALLFSPTGSPSTPAEDAFNPHIIDAIAGNNGYPSLGGYRWAARPYWDENASGMDIFNEILTFIG